MSQKLVDLINAALQEVSAVMESGWTEKVDAIPECQESGFLVLSGMDLIKAVNLYTRLGLMPASPDPEPVQASAPRIDLQNLIALLDAIAGKQPPPPPQQPQLIFMPTGFGSPVVPPNASAFSVASADQPVPTAPVASVASAPAALTSLPAKAPKSLPALGGAIIGKFQKKLSVLRQPLFVIAGIVVLALIAVMFFPQDSQPAAPEQSKAPVIVVANGDVPVIVPAGDQSSEGSELPTQVVVPPTEQPTLTPIPTITPTQLPTMVIEPPAALLPPASPIPPPPVTGRMPGSLYLEYPGYAQAAAEMQGVVIKYGWINVDAAAPVTYLRVQHLVRGMGYTREQAIQAVTNDEPYFHCVDVVEGLMRPYLGSPWMSSNPETAPAFDLNIPWETVATCFVDPQGTTARAISK